MGCDVTVVPASATATQVEALKPDGIFLSNGPGDPEGVPYAIEAVRELIGRHPIFGICLGHPRAGTPAADMPDQISAAVKQRRAAELADLEARLRTDYFRSLLGSQLEVLAETPLVGHVARLEGTAERYAPVVLAGHTDLIGKLVRARAAAIADGRIVGEP